MRQFFKPIEIDKEIEDNFDLSDYGNTSKEHKDSSKNSCTVENQFEIQNQNESHCSITEAEALKKPCDDVSLEVKFEKVYSRYCDIKKAETKWNGFSEKLSKNAINNDQLPDVIKSAIVNIMNETNNNRIFSTKSDSWSNCSTENKLKLITFMSLLRHKKINTSAENKLETSFDDAKSQKEETNVDNQPNTLNDSEISCIAQIECQLKYASQLSVSCETQKHNPPLSIQQIACSTPHKMSNVKIAQIPIQSPIVNSPFMSSFKQPHPINQHHHNQDKTNPRWYLKFLGLSTVFDLFLDDEENIAKNTSINNNKSDEEQAKFCDNLNKSVCGNHSLIEEENGSYTVSQILKICEDNDGSSKLNTNGILNESSIRRRRLYIGSVKDLFYDVDESNEGIDVIINTQTIDTSGSDDTVNYNVADAMAQQNNLHNSTNLFKDSIEGESSRNLSNVKAVTNTKSDELFSTYNGSDGNASKANASNITSNSMCIQNQPNQSIQTTPKKKNHNSSFFAYYCRSPSVLIKSKSILSAIDNTQEDQLQCNGGKTIPKSPSLLGTQLDMLNSQLNTSHLEEIDEIKENIPSSFATCKSSIVNHDEIPSLHEIDTDISEDDIFATCKLIPVSLSKYFFMIFILFQNYCAFHFKIILIN